MNSLKRNLFYQSAYQVLQIILPLITAPYVSRVLGPENIGIYSYTYNIANYFMLFANLGIANYGNREIAKVRDDQTKLNHTFSNIVTVHMSLTLVMIVIYVCYLNYGGNGIYSIICIIYLIGTFFDINWFFFGIEKFKITVTRNTIIRILSVMAIFVFVKDKNDLWKYIIIMALGNAVGQSMVWVAVPKYVKFVKPIWKELIKHIKPLLILFVPVIAISLYKNMAKIMIGIFSTTTQLGYFENADKVTNIPLGLITAVGNVMLPKMTNTIAKGNKLEAEKYIKISIKYIMIVAIAISFGIASVADVFTPLFFGDNFISSSILIQALSATIPFIAFANVLRTQFLIPNSCDKSYTISILIGAALNVCSNLLLIPRFGAFGAAISTIITEISVCVVQSIAVCRSLPVISYMKQCIFFMILGGGMFFISHNIGKVQPVSIVTLFLQVGVGAIFYIIGTVIFLWKTKDYVFIHWVNQRRNKK